MTESAAAVKAKTAKQAASSFAIPDYGIPTLEMPKIGLPTRWWLRTSPPAARAEAASPSRSRPQRQTLGEHLRVARSADRERGESSCNQV